MIKQFTESKDSEDLTVRIEDFVGMNYDELSFDERLQAWEEIFENEHISCVLSDVDIKTLCGDGDVHKNMERCNVIIMLDCSEDEFIEVVDKDFKSVLMHTLTHYDTSYNEGMYRVELEFVDYAVCEYYGRELIEEGYNILYGEV